MNSSDEDVLLESCWFLLNYDQEQIKRKRKRTWVKKIFKKIIEQGVYHNLLQETRVNDRELHFKCSNDGELHFSPLLNGEKRTASQSGSLEQRMTLAKINICKGFIVSLK